MAGAVTGEDAALLMRVLPEHERDEAIDNSPNVADLRPVLKHRKRQRDLAAFYRQAFSRKPPGGTA